MKKFNLIYTYFIFILNSIKINAFFFNNEIFQNINKTIFDSLITKGK